MAECHRTFREEIEQAQAALEGAAFAVQLPPANPEGGAEVDGGAAAEQEAHAAAARLMQRVGLLRRIARSVRKHISVVVFELQDGVAIQNMYDMLAQREKALLDGFFGGANNAGGRAMGQGDLVRNVLLNHIADEDVRYAAYDELWLPIERADLGCVGLGGRFELSEILCI
eukprot:4902325-Prymnesium_polylepis.3